MHRNPNSQIGALQKLFSRRKSLFVVCSSVIFENATDFFYVLTISFTFRLIINFSLNAYLFEFSPAFSPQKFLNFFIKSQTAVELNQLIVCTV